MSIDPNILSQISSAWQLVSVAGAAQTQAELSSACQILASQGICDTAVDDFINSQQTYFRSQLWPKFSQATEEFDRELVGEERRAWCTQFMAAIAELHAEVAPRLDAARCLQEALSEELASSRRSVVDRMKEVAQTETLLQHAARSQQMLRFLAPEIFATFRANHNDLSALTLAPEKPRETCHLADWPGWEVDSDEEDEEEEEAEVEEPVQLLNLAAASACCEQLRVLGYNSVLEEILLSSTCAYIDQNVNRSGGCFKGLLSSPRLDALCEWVQNVAQPFLSEALGIPAGQQRWRERLEFSVYRGLGMLRVGELFDAIRIFPGAALCSAVRAC